MADRDRANLDDPVVKKLLELVSMWWAEAGKYQVLPLDDRFFVRALGREALYGEREHMTFYEGAVRIQPFEAPQTLNRSWEMTAEIEVPESGANGPIVAMAGDSSGWSLYLKDSVPTFCYTYPGPEAHLHPRNWAPASRTPLDSIRVREDRPRAHGRGRCRSPVQWRYQAR